MKILFEKFALIFGIFLICYCGKTPQDPPPPATGTIRATAAIDSILVDSMEVFLDGDTLGVQPNSCLLTGLVAGKHQLAVTKKDPASPIDFSGIPKLVPVRENETTEVAFQLTRLAPNFTLKNLSNEQVTLENCRGKVVLMVFFSHT